MNLLARWLPSDSYQRKHRRGQLRWLRIDTFWREEKGESESRQAEAQENSHLSSGETN